VPGHLTTADLKNAVKEGGGQATFTMVQGEPLTITEMGARSRPRSYVQL
jgi:hypothetical protein